MFYRSLISPPFFFHFLRDVCRKNVVIQYDPIEIKVREATSNDAWGAKTTLMAEIARATNDQ